MITTVNSGISYPINELTVSRSATEKTVTFYTFNTSLLAPMHLEVMVRWVVGSILHGGPI